MVSAMYKMVMVDWPRVMSVKKGAQCGMGWLVVGSLAALAGLFILMARNIPEKKSFFNHATSLQPRRSRVQGRVPSKLFRPESNQILRGGHGRQPNLLERDGNVGTVTRSNPPSLESRTDVNVPLTIWRTARSRQGTPELATDLFNSWTKLNPGWDQYFMDDDDIEAFVAAHYNDTVLQAFHDLPLGVMKADLFRYASLPKTVRRMTDG